MTLAVRHPAPRRGLLLAGALGLLALAACGGEPPAPAAGFVGRDACASCHAAQDSLWAGSHHAAAMAIADSSTVLGNFDDATYTYNGVTSRFFRRDGRYWVNTEGPDGAPADYPILYTFGVYPLQQYLIAFPRGRVQALGLAWDSRTRAEGGQRWYHLYPDEKVDHRDVLHWTGMLQNWNFMCAQCHSTNLQKGYIEAADSYATTWSEINVSCEACHGPGSAHVALAERQAGRQGGWRGPSGLTVSFRDTTSAWRMDTVTGIANRGAPRTNRMEVETCGVCHARRGQVWPDSAVGQPLAQTQRVSLLDEGLYFADGQQEDEVYEYGSFLQSRMYRAGVTCSDCHEAHSGATRAAGNALCAACHLSSRYDVPAHLRHRQGGPGGRCVDCHMPARNYMMVDARRDHGMKIPRPDLTLLTGAPDACSGCHLDKPITWSVSAAAAWYGPPDSAVMPAGAAIAGGWARAPGAGDWLVALSRDTTRPGITRATAVTLMPQNPAGGTLSAIQMALDDPDPLLRRAAAEQLELLDPAMRAPMGLPLLADSIRTVRLAVLPALAGLPNSGWTEAQRDAYTAVLAEYRASQRFNADRPESWVNLGQLDRRLGQAAAAEEAFRRALRLQPQFVSAYLQLAELYRTEGREPQADSVLRMGLDRVPGSTDLEYQLGLALVRQGRKAEALPLLRSAAASGAPHYSYVYGVALFDAGQSAAALTVLQKALAGAPEDGELLYGLATIAAAAGRRELALEAAGRLLALDPNNREVQRLYVQLSGGPQGAAR